MTDSHMAALAAAWIADWVSSKSPEPGDARDRVWELCQDEPDSALQFVLEVLRRDHSDKILEVLSAGPLEDILAKHGERMIEQVETEARSNPLFARLLGSVWQNEMSDPDWRRVQAVWDRRGWDCL